MQRVDVTPGGTGLTTTTQNIDQAGFAAANLVLSGNTGAAFAPSVSSGNTFTVTLQ